MYKKGIKSIKDLIPFYLNYKNLKIIIVYKAVEMDKMERR